MHQSAVLPIVAILTIFNSYIECEEMYTTQWDNTNLDDILQSDRLLDNYVKCVCDEGKCTEDGAELKRVLKEALETDCSKCSEKQKEGAYKVIKFLMEHKPKVLAHLEAKYDPDGVYRTKYTEKYAIPDKS